jgi:hypothetical protein
MGNRAVGPQHGTGVEGSSHLCTEHHRCKLGSPHAKYHTVHCIILYDTAIFFYSAG